MVRFAEFLGFLWDSLADTEREGGANAPPFIVEGALTAEFLGAFTE